MFVLFFQQALSNIHSVRATISDKDPLTWTFNPKVTLLRLSPYVHKRNCTIHLFILSITHLVYPSKFCTRIVFTASVVLPRVGGSGGGRYYPVLPRYPTPYPYQMPFLTDQGPFSSIDKFTCIIQNFASLLTAVFKITKPERFLVYFTDIKCICQRFWVVLQTEMTDFPTLSYTEA